MGPIYESKLAAKQEEVDFERNCANETENQLAQLESQLAQHEESIKEKNKVIEAMDQVINTEMN